MEYAYGINASQSPSKRRMKVGLSGCSVVLRLKASIGIGSKAAAEQEHDGTRQIDRGLSRAFCRNRSRQHEIFRERPPFSVVFNSENCLQWALYSSCKHLQTEALPHKNPNFLIQYVDGFNTNIFKTISVSHNVCWTDSTPNILRVS